MKSKIKYFIFNGFIAFALVFSLVFGFSKNITFVAHAEYDLRGSDIEIVGKDSGTFSEHNYYHGVDEETGAIFNDESSDAYAFFDDETDTLHMYNPENNDIREITSWASERKFTIHFHNNGTYTINNISIFDYEYGSLEIVTDEDVIVVLKHINANDNIVISGSGEVYCFLKEPEIINILNIGDAYTVSWSTSFDADEFQIMVYSNDLNKWESCATLNNDGEGYYRNTVINYILSNDTGALVRYKICAYVDETMVFETKDFNIQWGMNCIVYSSNYSDYYNGQVYYYFYVDDVEQYVLEECPFEAQDGEQFAGYKIDESDELKQPGETVYLEDGNQIYAIWESAEDFFTISFNANGGLNSMNPVYGISGKYILPNCSLGTPENKIFKWKK